MGGGRPSQEASHPNASTSQTPSSLGHVLLGDAHGRGVCSQYSCRDTMLPGHNAPQKVNNPCPARQRGATTRTHEKHIGDAHGRGASGWYSCHDAMLPSQIPPPKVNNCCPATRRGAATRSHDKHIGDAHGRGASDWYSCQDVMLPNQIAPA